VSSGTGGRVRGSSANLSIGASAVRRVGVTNPEPEDPMSEYLLLIYTDQSKRADMSPDDWESMHRDYVEVTKAMNEAGVNKGGNPLQPPDTAKTVGPGGVITDGPFAEVTEFLGGYYLLDVADQDEALAWAAKLPGVTRGWDRIEVRPIMPFSMD
jgi:hypothetical protein